MTSWHYLLFFFNRYGSKRLKDTLGLYRGLSAGLFLTGQRYFLESERLAVSPCFQSLWETYVTYCFLFFLTKSESGISLSPSFTNFMYSFNIRLSKRKLDCFWGWNYWNHAFALILILLSKPMHKLALNNRRMQELIVRLNSFRATEQKIAISLC